MSPPQILESFLSRACKGPALSFAMCRIVKDRAKTVKRLKKQVPPYASCDRSREQIELITISFLRSKGHDQLCKHLEQVAKESYKDSIEPVLEEHVESIITEVLGDATFEGVLITLLELI